MRRLLILLAFSVFTLAARAQFDTLFDTAYPSHLKLVNTTHTERTILLSSYYDRVLKQQDSVAVFKNIKTLKQLAQANNDPELALEAELIKTHYYYFHNNLYGDKHIVLYLLDSLGKVADKQNLLWLRIRVESLLGHHNMEYLHQYETGLIHLTKAAQLMNDKDPYEYPLKQVCNYHVGIELNRFSDLTNAMVYMKRAAQTPVPSGMQDYKCTINNTLGILYRKLNRLDSSDYYFRKTYNYSVSENNNTWIGISAGNLGENYYLRHDFEKALPLLRIDAKEAVSCNDLGLAASALSIIGDIHIQKGEVLKARQVLDSARSFTYKSEIYERLATLYPRLAKLYALEGNAVMANMFVDSAILVNDSLARKLNTLLTMKAQQKIDRENYEIKLNSVENQKTAKVAERNMLIVSVIAIMIISLIVYNNLKGKFRKKQVELTISETELLTSRKQLQDFTNYLSEKNRQIEVLQVQAGESVTTALAQLQQQAAILTDEDWERFSALFEKVYPAFFEQLKTKLPALTPAEIRFIALSKLTLSGKEIAAILGVGTDAIRQTKSRLKKKLNLTTAQSIDTFIDTI